MSYDIKITNVTMVIKMYRRSKRILLNIRIYFSLLVPPIAYARSSKIEAFIEDKEDEIVQQHINWRENANTAQYNCARDCLRNFGKLIFIKMWNYKSTIRKISALYKYRIIL